MRLAAGILLIAGIGILTACDPGITIRQEQSSASSISNQPSLAVEIAPASDLIGSEWYVAKARITNLSNAHVTITSCELVAQGMVYQATLGGGNQYPIKLDPGETRLGCGFFKLKAPLYKTFKEPAEVRIHYSISSREEIVRVTVAGGLLQ